MVRKKWGIKVKFGYNGEKIEELRVKEVADDIVSFYKNIPFDLALFIARLESPIITPKDDIMIFKRLYNILFVLNYKNVYSEEFNYIYNDLYKVYNIIIKNEIYQNNEEIELVNNIYKEILKYLKKQRDKFPIISEFY